MTVATRARWRVVSDDAVADRVLLTSGEDGEVWKDDADGAGEGREVMVLLLRDAPPWINGSTLVNAASSLATRSKSSAFSRSRRSVLSFPFTAAAAILDDDDPLEEPSRRAAFSASSIATRSCSSLNSRFRRSRLSWAAIRLRAARASFFSSDVALSETRGRFREGEVSDEDEEADGLYARLLERVEGSTDMIVSSEEAKWICCFGGEV